jgi:transposase
MRTQEANRLAAGVTVDAVQASIEAVLAHLDAPITQVQRLIRDHLDQHPGLRAQRDLLTTIPGIGEATAAILLAELFDKRNTSARQAAAFAGLVPRLVESRTLRGRSRLSKLEPGRLRKALYVPP